MSPTYVVGRILGIVLVALGVLVALALALSVVVVAFRIVAWSFTVLGGVLA